MQTGATNFPVFVVGRVIGGIACGIVFSVCPTYASEISSPEIRGRVGALYGFNVNFAYMFTEWVGLGFYFIKGNAAWRTLLGVQLVPAAAMLIASFWMPFSPRWLIMQGRDEEALETLRKLHGGTHGGDDEFYMKEFHQIKAQYEIEKEEKLGIVAIFRRPSYRKRLYLIMTFSFFGQCTGIIPLQVSWKLKLLKMCLLTSPQNYQVTIYTNLGFTHVFSLVLTGMLLRPKITQAKSLICGRYMGHSWLHLDHNGSFNRGQAWSSSTTGKSASYIPHSILSANCFSSLHTLS